MVIVVLTNVLISVVINIVIFPEWLLPLVMEKTKLPSSLRTPMLLLVEYIFGSMFTRTPRAVSNKKENTILMITETIMNRIAEVIFLFKGFLQIL
jgi:hypothetical protein